MEMQFVLFWKLVDCELYIYLSLAAKADEKAGHLTLFGVFWLLEYVYVCVC